jgi:hypothetical protein
MMKRDDPLLVALGRVLRSELGGIDAKVIDLQQQIERITKFATDSIVDLGMAQRKFDREALDVVAKRLGDIESRLRVLEKSQAPRLRAVGE